MVILYLTHKAIIQPFYLSSPTCASSPFHTSHSSLHLWDSHSFLGKHSLDFAHVISSICFFISLIFTHFPGLHSDAVVSRKPCLPTPFYASYLPFPYLSKVFLHLYRLWLEKAMAPHSSTLAWKIPWTEEPGRLQAMGSQRVGHDWATSLSLFTFMHWRRKWQPTPVFLPGESQGRGSLVGCRLWGLTESDMTEVT